MVIERLRSLLRRAKICVFDTAIHNERNSPHGGNGTVMSAKRFGDRRDGKLLRDLDSMHIIVPHILPNRADNEAFISEQLDLSAAEDYLARRNEGNDGYKYNIFQLIKFFFTPDCGLASINQRIDSGKTASFNTVNSAYLHLNSFSRSLIKSELTGTRRLSRRKNRNRINRFCHNLHCLYPPIII